MPPIGTVRRIPEESAGPCPAAGGSMWYALGFLLLLALAQTYFLVPAGRQVPYSEFKSLVKQGKIAEATVGEQVIRGTLQADRLQTPSPSASPRRASRIRRSSRSSNRRA